jgi:hydroxymethylbilane synthase
VLHRTIRRRGRPHLRQQRRRSHQPRQDYLSLTRLVYATRKSALALAQSRAFVARLRGHEIAEKQITTSGDRIQDRPLFEVGGKGLFVKEIEEALLDGSADFAVHSLKDVPAVLPEPLRIVCIPTREDPRDALVAPRHLTLEALPAGAKVGTSSLRRSIALRAARPDLTVVPMRGNVDTRLRKVDAGEVDAIVLARAGLVRLGLAERATSILPPEVSLPAVGQGALAIEARAADARVMGALAPLHDAETATCVAVERGVMAALEGDCKTPLAAHARKQGDELELAAFIAEPDGSRLRRASERTRWPTSEGEAEAFGREIGRRLK